MLTLGGLTIAIGRVIDDSIVVIENAHRHLQEGDDVTTAAYTATREVAGAITASTLTTVAVFLPLGFVHGLASEFFRPFALTVTFALLASLLVRAHRRARAGHVGALQAHRSATATPDELTGLQRAYLPVLKLRHRPQDRHADRARRPIFLGVDAASPAPQDQPLRQLRAEHDDGHPADAGRHESRRHHGAPPARSRTSSPRRRRHRHLPGHRRHHREPLRRRRRNGASSSQAVFTITTDPDMEQERHRRRRAGRAWPASKGVGVDHRQRRGLPHGQLPASRCRSRPTTPTC